MSADRAGDELGISRQRDDCCALVQRRGWGVALEFAENDTSAAGRKPRPKFLALLAAIRAGQVDVVVAWALDRLTRNARDRLALIEACRDAGVMIALVRGSDIGPTTPAGRLTVEILGSVAQHEIDQKSDRQRRAAEQAAADGRWIGGRRPFGYADDGCTIVDDEAAAVREGYRAILEGASLRSVASAWNAAGLRTPQAPYKRTHLGERSPWRADSLRRLLLNPRYAGIRAHRRDGVRAETGPAEWSGLVDEQTFRAVGAVLTDDSRRTGGTAARQLLTGIAVCALEVGSDHDCGLTVHGGGASHRKPVYRCRSTQMLAAQRPTVPGTHVNRLAGPVDEEIGKYVVGRLSMSDARELLVDHHRAELPALRDELAALRVGLDALAGERGARLAAGDPMTAGEYEALRRPALERIAVAEAEIADAGRVDLLGPLVGAEDVALAWKALDVERQRAVVDLLMTVRLHAVGRGVRTFRPETVEVIWKADI